VSDVNRKIFQLLGGKIEPIDHGVKAWGNLYRIFSPAGDAMLRRTSYENENSWPEYEVDDVIPDYQHSLDEAITAMDCVEAPYRIYVDIQFTGASSAKGDDGKYTKGVARYSTRVSLHVPNDVLWLKTVESMEALPAAICAAILQAHGVTVEVSDDKQ
jgi:hypothetical protein